MITNIAKWGNGHAVRLSKEIMNQAKLIPSDKVTITVNGEEIILKKVKQTKAEVFDDLFRDFKGNWHCKEINTGVNIGNEVIK